MASISTATASGKLCRIFASPTEPLIKRVAANNKAAYRSSDSASDAGSAVISLSSALTGRQPGNCPYSAESGHISVVVHRASSETTISPTFSVDARPPAEPVLMITSGLQCSRSNVAPSAAATLPIPDFSNATSVPFNWPVYAQPPFQRNRLTVVCHAAA